MHILFSASQKRQLPIKATSPLSMVLRIDLGRLQGLRRIDCIIISVPGYSLATVIACALVVSASPLFAAGYVPGEIIVKFKPLGQAAVARDTRPYTVDVDDTATALAELKGRPDIAYAEPNYIITAETVPDDWGYDTSEWEVVDLPLAWNDIESQTSLTTVRIAVVDTGVDTDHPELLDVIVPGYNFIANSTDVEDDIGHGTRICGIMGAKGNNDDGIAGVAWDAPIQIMPIRVMESAGDVSAGSIADAVDGIYYAVDNGARIINASWGFDHYSDALKDAIVYALDHDVLFVCSAGNQHVNNDVVAHYPTNYNLDNIISVAAMTDDGQLASFSNYGSYGVHIAAPGEGLRTTDLDGQINPWVYGTSYAAAFVSGVAAMVLAENPRLTVRELRLRILQGSIISNEFSERINDSGGCVNAYNALQGIELHEITDTQNWTPPADETYTVAQSDDNSGGCLIRTAAGPGNSQANYVYWLVIILVFLMSMFP